jgi:hypothetical protein
VTVAIPEPEQSRALAHVDDWIPVVAHVASLAERIAGTEFVPRGLRDSAPAVAAAILYGREVGLPPMTALNVTHVIEGKPAISAEGMRAMVFAAGHEIVIEESTGATCIVKGRRRGADEWTRIGWNLDMARAAGVAGKQVWQRYPRQMLQARATAELCRLVFPDVTHGFRAVEEIDDQYEEGPPDAPASTSTSTVRRTTKKAAAKKAAPAPLEARPERPDGPPLPGEDGYTETSPGGAAPVLSEPIPGDPDDVVTDHEPGGDAEQGTPGGEGEGEAPEPPGGPAQPGPRLMSRAQSRGIFAALKDLGVDDDDDERHLIVSTILQRPVESFRDLTVNDAKTLLDTFARVEDKEQLSALLDEFDTPS